VIRPHFEPVALQDLGGERVEEIGRRVHNPAADLADQVVMRLGRQVVDRTPVAQMHVIDHTELLERVERAVDGGAVHVGVVGLHRGGQVVRALVRVIGREHGDHRAPHGRDANTLLAEVRQDRIRIHILRIPLDRILDRASSGGRGRPSR